MTASPPASAAAMGRFTLLPSRRRVLLDGEPVRLGARAVDLLHALAARRGEVVAKDELLQCVWPGRVVEENNLHVQVRALRRMLGRDAIVTVPGRGYALEGGIDIREEAQGPTADAPSHEGLTPLRGRSSEAATLRYLVRENRIVTVVGPTGVGKSRLVREVLGNEPAPAFQCIELDHADAGEALLVAAAASHGPSTLVVENAEHALDDAVGIAGRLAQSRGSRLVCTSQVPLHARGEHVLRVAPLEMKPALEMMVDSITTVQPGFSLDEESRREAAAICRHLDGIPLAIGLAAARVPLLGVSGVRRRLVDRFHLLAGAPRGTASRHQSLLAAIDWSWRLLSEREQAALASLSALPGRFTLHAASVQLARIATDEWDAMELVGALVDKSVVLADGHAAFRLLESTRLFAQARACRID